MEVMDNLQEGLNAKYERLNERLSTLDKDSKEYQETEAAMDKTLDRMQAFYKTSNEFWAKDEERRITEEHNVKMEELEKQKLEDHKDIEEERIAAQIQAEESKQKVTWQKAALEMAKILAPAALSAMVFMIGQERMIKFEETGRFTSSVSREIHLPRIFK